MKPTSVLGVHHVTAISGEAQRTLDFYNGVLGLRLVKLTVNFDDPGTYHLYFGDYSGRPGTLVTFFSWPGAPRGHVGAGQTAAIAFSVPRGSLDYWRSRLEQNRVSTELPEHRLDEPVLAFADRDGLDLELVGSAAQENGSNERGGTVPAEHAIRGVASVALWEGGYEQTARLLTQSLGFELAGESGNRFRYKLPGAGLADTVDLICLPSGRVGRLGVGTVHHVAWRTADDAEQKSWRQHLVAQGLNVTPVLDRLYFQSIYFREPGGVIFEIATDGPGFDVDEPLSELGTRLRLPPWLEQFRLRIERTLPPVRLPVAAEV
jgi:glyoxalase family protein